MEQGTTDNGVFAAKLMWQYLGDFVGLLRNVPAYSHLPLAELLPATFPGLTFVRVVRANKIRQAVSLWKAVQTASWSDSSGPASSPTRDDPPYRAFLDEHSRSCAFTTVRSSTPPANPRGGGELGRVLRAHPDQARARPLRELRRRLRDEHAQHPRSLGLEPPADLGVEPEMRRQSDGINDDWAKRFSELRLGTEFDLVPAVAASGDA